MKKIHYSLIKKIVAPCLLILAGTLLSSVSYAQSNNPISIYEGEQINSIQFTYTGLPADSIAALNLKTKIEGLFKIYPQSHYSSFMEGYYLSQINLLADVKKTMSDITIASQGGINIIVKTEIEPSKVAKKRNVATFPVLYNDNRTYITLKFASSEMVYTNQNSWFAQPSAITNGNPLATKPTGEGYSAWLEGFASAGVYGLTKIVPKINLNIYGGVSYLASFSAGDELFTNKARFFGDIEEAYAGFIGGGRTKDGHTYRYNTLYGRKQFVLGDGWLIINTSMNGDSRAALQLNPRWASKNVFQTGFAWDNIFIQGFRLQANELPILNSNTTINGVNLELGNKERLLIGATFLQVPRSGFSYYMPNGTVQKREGLQVYNIRVFKSAPILVGGLFFKAEGGFERNPNFDMKAWAYYAELGWNFASSFGRPSISYRYASFSGDNANSNSYNRWDALYTGGTGEQWVQGSNMYKMVQNSNENTHRIQAVFSPLKKMQLVGQVWLFYADQKNNLGGNPALSLLKSKYYGTEYNLTVKYFHSKSWYFHLNTAYTMPGAAIKDNVPNTKDWFCLSAFARYSF